MAYDYLQAMKEDIREYIENEVDKTEWTDDRDGMEKDLYDTLFVEDSVTGNASGSYYCNAWKAEEALCHNLDLLGEALSEFGSDPAYLLKNGAEAADVTIRCYLLGQALNEVLDDLEYEGYFDEEEVNITDYETFEDFCGGRDCNKCPLFCHIMADKAFDCEEYFNNAKREEA